MPTPVFHKLIGNSSSTPGVSKPAPCSQGVNESFVKWWEAEMFHQTKAAGNEDKERKNWHDERISPLGIHSAYSSPEVWLEI